VDALDGQDARDPGLHADVDLAFLKEHGFCFERSLSPANALMLRDLNSPHFEPLVVDFLSGQLKHRRQYGLSKNDPFSRAIGFKNLQEARDTQVLDLTAGMGVDAFVLACLGCRVTAIEHSPIVFSLLQDGWHRLEESEQEVAVLESHRVSSRLHFQYASAESILAALDASSAPDVIYLDPMFPKEERSSSALPKKEMQILRRLLQLEHQVPSTQAAEQSVLALLETARKTARRRAVLKRPVGAPILYGRATHSFSGKTARFDMYLTERK
jgi:16S rRNA (guanine1516-N2)-methyltransferase